MNLSKSSLISGSLFGAIILMVVLKCVMLSRITFDMDRLKTQVKPLQSKLSKNNRVGFHCNDKATTFTIYQEVKFAIAPAIFVNEPADTLIYFEVKGQAPDVPKNYRRIITSKDNQCDVSLLVKL